MDLVLLTLDPPAAGAGERPDGALVADILWANSVPADRLDHVKVLPDPAGGALRLAVFVGPGSVPGPHAAAVRLCRRAVAASSLLTGWTLADAALADLAGLANLFPRNAGPTIGRTAP